MTTFTAETHIRGRQGVHKTSYLLSRMGWGVIENSTEDAGNGIDLILYARERVGQATGKEFVDVGVAAAQVKTRKRGRKHRPPKSDWSFRDETSLLETWSSGPLPFILFLYDPVSESVWWTEVSMATARVRGSKFSVTVPLASELDDTAGDELLAIIRRAGERTRGHTGSIWNLPGSVGRFNHADQRRSALLVPRLVAPHANALTSGELTATQALAMIAGGRKPELEDRASRPAGASGPIADLLHHDDWDWRFVSALAASANDDPLPAAQLAANAPDDEAMTAAIIVSACAFARSGDLLSATQMLGNSLEDLGGFDRAWTAAQLGRFKFESGEVADAVALLEEAALIVAADPRPHAAAVLAAALVNRVHVRDDSTPDLPQVISALDIHATWWLAASHSAALSRFSDESFSEEYDAASVTLTAEDVVEERLGGTSLIADLAGNHDLWRSETRLRARLGTTRYVASPDRVGEFLELLRRAGDHRGTELVARGLIRKGDHQSVRPLMRDPNDASWWTRSNALSNWRLMRVAGPTLPVHEADRLATFCMGAVEDNQDLAFLENLGSRGHLRALEALEVLGTCIRACSSTVRDTIANWLLDVLPGAATKISYYNQSAVVSRLPESAFQERSADWAAWAIAAESDSDTSNLVLAALAADDQSCADELVKRSDLGSLSATWHLATLGPLTRTTVDTLLERVQLDVDASVPNKFGPIESTGLELAVAGLTGEQDPVRWSPIVDLLCSPHARGILKLRALLPLLRMTPKPPESVLLQLKNRSAEVEVFLVPPIRMPSDAEDPSAMGIRLLLAALVDPRTVELPLVGRLAASSNGLDRQCAAVLASQLPSALAGPVLISLVRDDGASTSAVREVIRVGAGDNTVAELVASSIDLDTPAIAYAVADELSDLQLDTGSPLKKFAEALETYPHAVVRDALTPTRRPR